MERLFLGVGKLGCGVRVRFPERTVVTDEQVYGVVAAWEEARERGRPEQVEELSDDPAVVAAALKVLAELNASAVGSYSVQVSSYSMLPHSRSRSARAACCPIATRRPHNPWNASLSMSSSITRWP